MALEQRFSISASRAALKASRSVLQKRHLMAAALIVSPQTGHCFVSSLIPASSITRSSWRRLGANICTP
jgi:hypothetical protein